MKSSDVMDLIRGRFPPPAYALLPLVRNRTGFGGQERYADALAMSLWPSRGFDLHGFEIKVSRGDWIREVKNPEKAEAIFQYCNYWWLVADAGVAQEAEVPSTWGLMIPSGRGLRVVRAAPVLTPKPPSLSFIASILRRASQVVTPDPIIRAAEDRGRKEGRESMLHIERHAAELKKAIDDFEDAAGVRISSWNAGSIGNAVRVVLNGEHVPALKDLIRIRSIADLIKKQIDGVVDEKGNLRE